MNSIKNAWDMVAAAKLEIDNLSPAELEAEISAGTATVVDIRDNRELYLKGKIPGSISAPRGMLEFWIDPASEYYRDTFKADKRYIVYCAGGGRSALAAKTMKDMGYTDIGHLETGFAGWLESGNEVEDTQDSAKWIPRPKD